MGDRLVDARDIKDSVVVTGDGNTVALTFGDTGIVLPLRRKQFPPPDRRRSPRAGEPPRELDLLVADTGKLPLIGRLDLIEELQAWLDDEADISVYGLIGRAGTGKTRLAIDFCRMIDGDPAAKGEWLAGFLSPTDLSAVVETLATHSFAWERQTLLVIDYAAQCHQVLARWLDRLTDQMLDTKLRFLLLDRKAPEAFGWWQELTVLGPPSRRDLFYELRPRQLPDLSDLEERRALTTEALQAARKLRTELSSSPPIPARNEDADFDRRLAQAQFGNPLNLVMAGVIALDRGPQAALALRRLDAARQIARREFERRLKPLALSRQIGDDTIRHIVAFNGLAGGLPIADLRKTVADELAISRRPIDRLSEIVELLEQEYPTRSEAAGQPRLSTIQPDLIGEAAIVEAFTGSASRGAEAVEAVYRAYQLAPDAAAQALIHIVQDFAYSIEDPSATEGQKTTGLCVMGWLLNLAREIDDPERLAALVEALPVYTTILREPSAELTEQLASHFLRKAEEGNDPVAQYNAATWLGNLGVRLNALGQHEAALTAVEEAVRLRRSLAEAYPDTLVASLARSLSILANALSALGRREEALNASEEVIRLYRAVPEAHLDALASELALSLNNLAISLSDLGRREEALTAAGEAVGLYRDLTKAVDALIPDLARSLNTFATMLSGLGRHEEALAAIEEAVSLRRSLAQTLPDAFIPDLASSLTNLAATLSALDRREEALTAAEEAVGHYRALAEARPDAFIPDLAISLNNIANWLGDLGRREEALRIAEEAVRLRRGLAAARPDAFLPNLAASLNNLANRLSDLGRREEALRIAEEAVRLLRSLSEARPDVVAPQLARSLGLLGDLYLEAGNPELLIATRTEAIQLLMPVFKVAPTAVSKVMAALVRGYLKQCTEVGREPDEELLSPVLAVFEGVTPREEKR